VRPSLIRRAAERPSIMERDGLFSDEPLSFHDRFFQGHQRRLIIAGGHDQPYG